MRYMMTSECERLTGTQAPLKVVIRSDASSWYEELTIELANSKTSVFLSWL